MATTDRWNFTELVQRKIEERREGRSAVVLAAAAADARFRARVAPLATAVLELLQKLSDAPMFANAMGKPAVTITRRDSDGREGKLIFEGLSGYITFNVTDRDKVFVLLYPSLTVSEALDCHQSTYGIDPIEGDLLDIDKLLDRVCDRLGDLFADIYLSPAAHILGSEPPSAPSISKW